MTHNALTVFVELESQLQDEFDFVAEAAAMDRIYHALIRAPDGTPRDVPLVIPRPVPGLVSRRVLVQDYLEGIPLSRARDAMIAKGIDPNGPEAKLFGLKLLKSLTAVFGRTILETGFFHAEYVLRQTNVKQRSFLVNSLFASPQLHLYPDSPHPGNILVMEDGAVGLIDFGQVKQISGRNRETLCKVMIALDERKPDEPADMDLVGQLSLELGVKLNDNAKGEAAAAIGIWLFDGTVTELPGGYDMGELSPNSPVRELKSFPQDLVLVGRSTILIKGLSSRLDIPWSLAKEWAPIARQVLSSANMSCRVNHSMDDSTRRVRFREVLTTLRQWSQGRLAKFIRGLPSPTRTRVAKVAFRLEQRKTRLAAAKASRKTRTR
jgi:aarF domain-containing kinase